jgi:DNA-binding GntR family transcriptional regulator
MPVGDGLQIERKASTLRTMVEDRLRAAICSGRFKPGQRLVERELCELIDVSRTSVREALRQLEAEGLVTSVPHRGPVVSTISMEEARQLYAVRALLEGFAGECFAKRGSDADIAALRGAVDRIEDVVARGGDRAELVEAKTSFYAILMQGGGNVFVRQMLGMMHNRITLLRFTSMTQEGRLAQSLKEIQAIYRAIAARDGAAARQACVSHIQAATDVAIAVLAQEEAASSGPAAPEALLVGA